MKLRFPLLFVTFILATNIHALIDKTVIYSQYPYHEYANLVSNISFFSLAIIIFVVFELTKLNKKKIKTHFGFALIFASVGSAVLLKVLRDNYFFF
ncbi:hypothetical protein BKP37_06375 [Anaerobacillus alkalilacustris]|uniref:Uncharacterized protein n=1 Tax=Anaerobacillus alkalilacustris TaxID=393763 RepID=A0A1S2LVH7_9BACI|nr:hypothetical protein [Anaerobacillus alkalilacustris]OIJ16346.1 hypothetical protein BKP37_06375 [Anaerobacillus alkalilacustris]